ncbi:hypothetical protein L208DRAFT_1528165 [Tricholoma matsutake]|nr:hypothetical protein L208DRAFT_1528165 [Tricholoma matsutake 945]
MVAFTTYLFCAFWKHKLAQAQHATCAFNHQTCQCQEKQAQIDNTVSEWYTYTITKADEMGKWFDKKPHHFLDIFFQGSARIVNHHNNMNAYNAFKSLKATEEGNLMKLIMLQQEYHEEYEALTKEEKDELIEEFKHISKKA